MLWTYILHDLSIVSLSVFLSRNIAKLIILLIIFFFNFTHGDKTDIMNRQPIPSVFVMNGLYRTVTIRIY